jgi:beta-lactamase class A
MKGGWDVQYTNWAEPAAMARLLRAFYEGRLLAKENNELLLKLMTESENSPNRIKGLLPATAVVAHKTGTSNTNDQGLTAATNDIGIVGLPDGRHFAAVVFVSDYRGGVAKGEQLIARLSKLAWDYFSK